MDTSEEKNDNKNVSKDNVISIEESESENKTSESETSSCTSTMKDEPSGTPSKNQKKASKEFTGRIRIALPFL